jgi:uncharacterized protein with PIN domain/sulfur carrier protein ThiS
MNAVTVRLYGPLNDFLAPAQRHAALPVCFAGSRSVKDLIEGLGVPHPEIDLILLNGESVPFESAVENGDRVAAFPRFHAVDIAEVTRVRPRALETTRFLLDGHLGTLARRLRLVGLDAMCPAGADDDVLATRAAHEDRILLTRDRALLKRRLVTHGYFVRETRPHRQLVEILHRYDPLVLEPFSRCLHCNLPLEEVSKAAVESRLLPRTREHYGHFQTCRGCGRIYWEGSHWTRLAHAVDAATVEAAAGHFPAADGPPATNNRRSR